MPEQPYLPLTWLNPPRRVKSILRNRAKCLKCQDVVESFSVHDFRYCRCQAMAVDGGLDYIKRVGQLEQIQELSRYEWEEIPIEEILPVKGPTFNKFIGPGRK